MSTAVRQREGTGHVVRPLGRSKGWGPTVRIARRDMAGHRGRTLLAVLLLGLPIGLASGIAVLAASYDVSAEEALPGQIGSAAAAVRDTGYESITQYRDGSVAETSESGRDLLSEEQLSAAVSGARLIPVDLAFGRFAPEGWSGDPDDLDSLQSVVVDSTDPVTAGLHVVVRGRLPSTTDEIAVSPGTARLAGVDVGDDITVAGEDVDGELSPTVALRVVGIAVRQAEAAGGVTATVLPGALGASAGASPPSWLVDSDAPVGAAELESLNARGLVVVAPGVLRDPPASVVPDTSSDGAPAAVLYATTVVLVVLEIVLLAAPAFAVGVRQQRGNLALLAATGADARTLRRVVLTEAGMVGAVATAAGLALGALGTAALLVVGFGWLPGARGPVELPAVQLALITALGVGAAVLAAWLPARAAAKADVAATLAGRRGVTAWPWRLGVTGAALAVAGGVVIWLGAAGSGSATPIALGILASAVGVLLTVPLLVASLGVVARWLPLPLRLAARDTARSAGRSIAAVAAVAGVAGGVTAMGTWGLSSVEFDRSFYLPQLVTDRTLISYDSRPLEDPTALPATVSSALPAGFSAYPVGRAMTELDTGFRSWFLPSPGCTEPPDFGAHDAVAACQASDSVVNNTLVADEPALAALGYELAQADLAVLRNGGVLLVGDEAAALAPDDVLTVIPLTAQTEQQPPYETTTTSGEAVQVSAAAYSGDPRPASYLGIGRAVMLPGTAERVVGWSVTEAIVDGPRALSTAEESTLEDLGGVYQLYTERGYQLPAVNIVLLGIAAAAVIALGAGTLAAAGLALVDARATHEVLSDVGARGRTRRVVAGATAVVIAGTGAVAGTAMGLGPGLALARLSTSGYYDQLADRWVEVDPTLVFPWPVVLGTVVVLPLLLGTLVAASARGYRTTGRAS